MFYRPNITQKPVCALNIREAAQKINYPGLELNILYLVKLSRTLHLKVLSLALLLSLPLTLAPVTSFEKSPEPFPSVSMPWPLKYSANTASLDPIYYYPSRTKFELLSPLPYLQLPCYYLEDNCGFLPYFLTCLPASCLTILNPLSILDSQKHKSEHVHFLLKPFTMFVFSSNTMPKALHDPATAYLSSLITHYSIPLTPILKSIILSITISNDQKPWYILFPLPR